MNITLNTTIKVKLNDESNSYVKFDRGNCVMGRYIDDKYFENIRKNLIKSKI